MSLYSLKKISHQIDGKLVFTEISEVISSGEIIEIRGINGSGKTTLLKIITGLITCKGIDSNDYVADQISYLGHKNGFVEEITLRQNFEILNIQIEERGESFYNKYLKNIVQELESKNIIVEDQKAKCVFLEGIKNKEGKPLPLIIQKKRWGI